MVNKATGGPLKALVVDDEPTTCLILSSLLKDQGVEGHSCHDASGMQQALAKTTYDLLFLDYCLGEDNGLEILQTVIKEYPELRVIMITAHGSIELALEAVHLGASGFVTKPFHQDKLEKEIHRAMRPRHGSVLAPATKPKDGGTGIIGVSPVVERIHQQIHKMKDVPTTVLIHGESGTGKELIARALHETSGRAKERFEAVNCAAIPETLLEAELFGYRKGAFTDAKQDRKGLFETCSDGTLFLDEIGEIPLPLQSKLLRVLQEKTLTPLGSSTSIKVKTRVVAATNRSLKRLVEQGKFRKDLYYRLSILEIESPPLRDRTEDIPALVAYFREQICREVGKQVEPPSAEIMARLEAHPWPGNIRELQNSLERAIVLSEEGKMSAADLFQQQKWDNDDGETGGVVNCDKPLTEAKEDFEKSYLEKLLTITKGNVSKASRVAGRIRTDMYRLFSKYDLDPTEFKQ